MKNLLNERSSKLFKKLFENQGVDTKKYENYSLEEGPYTSARHADKVGSPGTRGWEEEGRTKETPETVVAFLRSEDHDGEIWNLSRGAFADLAVGEDNSLRDQYPGWGNDDFAVVFKGMEGEWPPGFEVDNFSNPDLMENKKE